MKATHKLGRLDVHGVLVPERALLDAEDEAEMLHLLGEFGELEALGLLIRLVEVVKLEGLEVRDEDVARQFRVFEAGEVVERLCFRSYEVAAGALVLDKQHALPEQVDESVLAAKLLDRLLESRNLAALDAEHVEEVVVEALRLAFLIGGGRPFVRKSGGAGANFVPRQAHWQAFRGGDESEAAGSLKARPAETK